MPEGPEIRLEADKIGKIINHQTVQVHFSLPQLEEFDPQLSGQRVDQATAKGKAMLIHFEDGLTIYSHNQLYGRWVTTRTPEPPSTRRQIRLRLQTPKGCAWLLSATDIEVLDASGLANHSYLASLGPDPLSLDNPGPLKAQLEDRRFARRGLAALLLDQSFVAGIGNYLRSEILFEAGLRAEHRLAELPQIARLQLAEAIYRMCWRSYQSKGLTAEAELVKRLKQQGLARREYRFRVFGRQGKACFRCGATIMKTLLAGRRLYFCPDCQN